MATQKAASLSSRSSLKMVVACSDVSQGVLRESEKERRTSTGSMIRTHDAQFPAAARGKPNVSKGRSTTSWSISSPAATLSARIVFCA